MHGHESPEDTAWVAERVPVTIKAFPAGHEGLQHLGDYGADAVLIDSKRPGSGEVFDWSLAEGGPAGGSPADPGGPVSTQTTWPEPSAGCSRGEWTWPAAWRADRAARTRPGCGPSSRRPRRPGPSAPHDSPTAGGEPRRTASPGPYDWEQEPVTAPAGGFMGEPSADGRFGDFGGMFVPETLVPACQELDRAFRSAWCDAAFRGELKPAAARLRRPALAPHRVLQPVRGARVAHPVEARGPQSHRQPQDQQRARPDPAGPAHGQDQPGGRDRRGPARGGHRHRGPRCSAWTAWCTWAPSTSPARS